MSEELRIPKIGMGMTEGKLVEWFVADGAAVQEGDILYSVETDKTVSEIPSPSTGTLEIIGLVNETYDIGTLIGKIS